MSILGDHYATDSPCEECGADEGEMCSEDCPIVLGETYDRS